MYSPSLYGELKARASLPPARFHMPGHHGRPLPGGLMAEVCAIDFTELDATGDLYAGRGPVREAERRAEQVFGVDGCLFLTGGSTQGVHAMLLTALRPGDRVLCGRDCHRAVYNAFAMYGYEPEYVYPEYIAEFGIPGVITPEFVDEGFSRTPDARALIVTSPTYYGVIRDIPAIAEVCRAYGAHLLVDAAHGAHLDFCGSRNPVREGAALACVSMHKTLPALGQSAMLLSSGAYGDEALRHASSLCGTSSPSYPVMASIDAAARWMEAEGRAACAFATERVSAIRAEVNARGVLRALDLPGCDPLRLCVRYAREGLCGREVRGLLEENGAVCEMAEGGNALFIISPADTQEDFDALSRALCAIERFAAKLPQLTDGFEPSPRAVRAMSPRAALFAPCQTLPLHEAAGRTAARQIASCPPGVPIVAAGEVIQPEHVRYMESVRLSGDFVFVVSRQGL